MFIEIDGRAYPLLEQQGRVGWSLLQAGRALEELWDDWSAGMGETRRVTGRGYSYTYNMDATAKGMLRLSPFGGTTSLSTSDGVQGYFFEAQSSTATYVYLVEGQYIHKFQSDGTYVSTTSVTGGSAGRPASFNGKWYVPFGSVAYARRLDTVADPPTADTWTAMTWYADHLATYQQGSTPMLARAHTTNQVSLSSDASSWGSDVSVGDSSTAITDLLEAQGFLYVPKEDNLYEFDEAGNSRPAIPFLIKQASDPDNGKGSHAFGDIIFYPCTYGLWRYRIGSGAVPVGPDEIASNVPAPQISPPLAYRHRDVTSAGGWIYALYDDRSSYACQVLVGQFRQVRREGFPELLWHTLHVGGRTRGIYISSSNDLWTWNAYPTVNYVEYIPLAADGSPRIESDRSPTGGIYTVFDERDFNSPFEKKQLQLLEVETENWVSSASLQMSLSLDGAAFSDVGSAITSSGISSIALGTSYTCYRVRPRVTVTLSSHDGTDCRILRVRLRAKAPAVYEALIPASEGDLRGYGLSPRDARQTLARLQNRGLVTIREPGAVGTTFQGEVNAVEETTVDTGQGLAWALRVLINRWTTE